jgi:hypothetical protein
VPLTWEEIRTLDRADHWHIGDASGLTAETRRKSARWEDSIGGTAMPAKRELIDTGADKRFVRRDDEGKFEEVVNLDTRGDGGEARPVR